MRALRVLAGLGLATSIACAPSSASLRTPFAAVTDSSPPRAAGELRVMTFNIQSAIRGMDGVVEVIRSASPDIVALQEVDVGSRRAKGADQPAVLAERTGLSHHAHFRTTELHGGAYGVALISRHPLRSVAQYVLPERPGAEPRTVAHAIMDVEGREISVYVTHLTRRPFNGSIRARQSAAIVQLMSQDPRPKLLLGDMNDTPDSHALKLLKRELMDVFALRGEGTAETFPLPFLMPDLRIDYVLASHNFMPRHSQVIRVGASDHYPVVADLTLLEPLQSSGAEVVERPRPQAPDATP